MEDQTKSNIISESKVPEVTLGFWIIKIAATTLGETGGDTVTMTLNWGYLAGTCLFLAAMIVLVAAQVRARKFNPALYWATIVASTTFGTFMLVCLLLIPQRAGQHPGDAPAPEQA
jgi:uncharacterized membrane-anchored protein